MKKIVLTLITTFTMLTASSQEISNPPGLFDPTPYGFSHVAAVPAGSTLIFVAGQGGEENKEGKLPADFRTQLQHSLKNIQIALKTKGATLSSVVKITTLIVDHDQAKLKVLIEEMEKMWPDKKFPVNTLIPVPKLALDGMLVEIDAIAVKKGTTK